jgi:hypothetical protein
MDNNGNDEDLDEEVQVGYEEEEEEEEEEEDSNEDEECAAEEIQTEHINVTPNKKGKLKATKQVTAKTTAQMKAAVKTTQDIHCTELESDEEKKTEKLNKKETAFVPRENTAAPCIMELLSDDEMEAKAKVTTPLSSSSKKKTGMSFEDYKKKPEVAQKIKRNDFYDWVICNIFVSNDCSNFFVASAIVNRNGTNSLSFPHNIFHGALMCAAHCDVDVAIIEKYSEHLVNGEILLKRAVPHGKNECSYNMYKENKTEHKFTGFVFPRNGMDIESITSEVQKLFDNIVATDNFRNLCKEHASNATYQGPSMIAMQDDNSSVWNYLRGHLQGIKVSRTNVMKYLDELLLDGDIKNVLKKMYGEKEYKKKGNVGWKKYSMPR